MIGRAAVAGVATILMVVVLGAAPGDAADANRRFSVRGLGTTPCSSYLDVRAGSGRESEPFVHWLTGFVTAYNWLQPDTFDISAEYNSTGLLIWLDYYCKGNPESKIIDAALAFVRVVYDKRMKSES
ncbi:MAG: hypothetical protein AB7S71_24020 [Dongiaceae bacterium]